MRAKRYVLEGGKPEGSRVEAQNHKPYAHAKKESISTYSTAYAERKRKKMRYVYEPYSNGVICYIRKRRSRQSNPRCRSRRMLVALGAVKARANRKGIHIAIYSSKQALEPRLWRR